MRILIVDDEPPARQRLVSLVADADLGEVVAEAANGRQALAATEAHRPDVLLLDIRMPGMDGLEVARHLAGIENPPAVIFTTAFDSHALAAFEANAVDYLLKPIRKARLSEAVERAKTLTRAQLTGLQGADAGSGVRTHLSATMSDKLELVAVDEIRYLRAEHKYVTVGHPGGQLLVEDSLSTLEEEFGDRFLRVHRNALVAQAYVRSLEKDANGRNVVFLTEVQESIEVSRRLKASVRKVLKQGLVERTQR